MINTVTIKTVDKNPFRGSTAWHIFDRENLYPFTINQAHFRVKTGRYRFPIHGITDPTALKQMELTPISTNGTIIEISDYFKEGGMIGFLDKETPKNIYLRILAHMEAHYRCMTTDKSYLPPEDDTLRELAEFATAIHYKAIEADPNLDKARKSDGFFKSLGARSFITFSKPEVDKVVKEIVPKSITQMDAIEKYLAQLGR